MNYASYSILGRGVTDSRIAGRQISGITQSKDSTTYFYSEIIVKKNSYLRFPFTLSNIGTNNDSESCISFKMR